MVLLSICMSPAEVLISMLYFLLLHVIGSKDVISRIMIITCNCLDPSKFLVDAAKNSFIDTTVLYKQFPSLVV
jgi:hypothetical protein